MEIKIVDNMFGHASWGSASTIDISPKYFKWYRGNENRDVCVFTDNNLQDVDSHIARLKIAWLMESPAITPNAIEYIKSNYKKFNYVLTTNESLLTVIPNAIQYALGGQWIHDPKIYEKTKKISIIASTKGNTRGQALRQHIVQKYGYLMDVYGTGRNHIQKKQDGLKDYRYSVIIENCDINYYFSEKINDCLLCGTIPIFWGCDIGSFYDMNGILQFKTLDQFDTILKDLTDTKYQEKMRYIKKNYDRALQYCCVEDQLWEKLFWKLF